MNVSERMETRTTKVQPAATCDEMARRMREESVGMLLVEEAGKLAGIVTDRGIVTECLAQGRDPRITPASTIMIRDTISVRPDQPIEHAMRIMREHGFRRLPVAEEDGTVRGVISLADIAPYVRELVDGVLEEVAAYRHAV